MFTNLQQKHQYLLDISTEAFTIQISQSTSYGWFEHNELGDDCGGGLWFEGNQLTDYDGVAVLPRRVAEALKKAGFDTSLVD